MSRYPFVSLAILLLASTLFAAESPSATGWQLPATDPHNLIHPEATASEGSFAAKSSSGLGATDAASSASQPTRESTIPERKLQQRVSDVCRSALLRMRGDLHELGNRFPELADIEAAELVVAPVYSEETNTVVPVRQALRYYKNVHFEKAVPDSNGRVPPVDGWWVVDKGGMKLQLYVIQEEMRISRRKEYTLGPRYKNVELRLLYDLAVKPKSEELEKAVEDVIQRNVSMLRDELSSIGEAGQSLR